MCRYGKCDGMVLFLSSYGTVLMCASLNQLRMHRPFYSCTPKQRTESGINEAKCARHIQTAR